MDCINSSPSGAVLRQLNEFEAGLRTELPQLNSLPVSIATAQLILDMQRARLRYERFLESARNDRSRTQERAA